MLQNTATRVTHDFGVHALPGEALGLIQQSRAGFCLKDERWAPGMGRRQKKVIQMSRAEFGEMSAEDLFSIGARIAG